MSKSNVIDYGLAKTIKHVDTTLPHKNPKTLEQAKQNLSHLSKIRTNTNKQIEHHEWEHKSAMKYRDVIQPKFEKMGYTANAKIHRKELDDSVKFHAHKLNHYNSLKDQTDRKIVAHKALVDMHNKAAKTKPVRRLATKIPAEHMQTHASLDIIKDHNYFARKARLIKLKIDHDVRNSIDTENTSRSKTEFEHEYNSRMMKHPLYRKMSKAFKHSYNERRRLGLPTYASEIEPYHNLMMSIYEDCDKKLSSQNIDHTNQGYSDRLEDEIKHHPDIMKLEILRRK